MTLHSTREFALGSQFQPGGPGIVGAPTLAPLFISPVAVYQSGSEIYAQGEKAGLLYSVEIGCVRLYRLLADGRRQISAFRFPGEVFGFEASGTHHFFAEAVGTTSIQSISPSAQRNHQHGLLAFALKDLIRAQEHLLLLGRQHALERVAI